MPIFLQDGEGSSAANSVTQQIQGIIELLQAISQKNFLPSIDQKNQINQAVENTIAKAASKLVNERGEALNGSEKELFFQAEEYSLSKIIQPERGDIYSLISLDDPKQRMEFQIHRKPDNNGNFRDSIEMISNSLSREAQLSLLENAKGVYEKKPKELLGIDAVNWEIDTLGALATQGSKAVSIAHDLVRANDDQSVQMKYTYVSGKDGSISICSNPENDSKDVPKVIAGLDSKGKVHSFGMNQANRTDFSLAFAKWASAKQSQQFTTAKISKATNTSSSSKRER